MNKAGFLKSKSQFVLVREKDPTSCSYTSEYSSSDSSDSSSFSDSSGASDPSSFSDSNSTSDTGSSSTSQSGPFKASKDTSAGDAFIERVDYGFGNFLSLRIDKKSSTIAVYTKTNNDILREYSDALLHVPDDEVVDQSFSRVLKSLRMSAFARDHLARADARLKWAMVSMLARERVDLGPAAASPLASSTATGVSCSNMNFITNPTLKKYRKAAFTERYQRLKELWPRLNEAFIEALQPCTQAAIKDVLTIRQRTSFLFLLSVFPQSPFSVSAAAAQAPTRHPEIDPDEMVGLLLKLVTNRHILFELNSIFDAQDELSVLTGDPDLVVPSTPRRRKFGVQMTLDRGVWKGKRLENKLVNLFEKLVLSLLRDALTCYTQNHSFPSINLEESLRLKHLERFISESLDESVPDDQRDSVFLILAKVFQEAGFSSESIFDCFNSVTSKRRGFKNSKGGKRSLTKLYEFLEGHKIIYEESDYEKEFYRGEEAFLRRRFRPISVLLYNKSFVRLYVDTDKVLVRNVVDYLVSYYCTVLKQDKEPVFGLYASRDVSDSSAWTHEDHLLDFSTLFRVDESKRIEKFLHFKLFLKKEVGRRYPITFPQYFYRTLKKPSKLFPTSVPIRKIFEQIAKEHGDDVWRCSLVMISDSENVTWISNRSKRTLADYLEHYTFYEQIAFELKPTPSYIQVMYPDKTRKSYHVDFDMSLEEFLRDKATLPIDTKAYLMVFKPSAEYSIRDGEVVFADFSSLKLDELRSLKNELPLASQGVTEGSVIKVIPTRHRQAKDDKVQERRAKVFEDFWDEILNQPPRIEFTDQFKAMALRSAGRSDPLIKRRVGKRDVTKRFIIRDSTVPDKDLVVGGVYESDEQEQVVKYYYQRYIQMKNQLRFFLKNVTRISLNRLLHLLFIRGAISIELIDFVLFNMDELFLSVQWFVQKCRAIFEDDRTTTKVRKAILTVLYTVATFKPGFFERDILIEFLRSVREDESNGTKILTLAREIEDALGSPPRGGRRGAAEDSCTPRTISLAMSEMVQKKERKRAMGLTVSVTMDSVLRDGNDVLAKKSRIRQRFRRLKNIGKKLKLISIPLDGVLHVLCYESFRYFSRISPSEFFDLGWTRPNRQTVSPNLLKNIERFNSVSDWACSEITKEVTNGNAKEIFVYMIRLAYELREMGNFSDMLAVFTGIQAPVVIEFFEMVRKDLPDDTIKKYDDLEYTSRSDNGYSVLRKEYKKRIQNSLPTVPWLGTITGDLIHISELDLWVTDKLMNVNKLKWNYQTLNFIAVCQSTPYKLFPDKAIKKFVDESKRIDDQKLWEMHDRYISRMR